MKNIAKALAAVALLPSAALAEDQIIVTAIGAGQRSDETGQAVTLIDRALIDQRQSQSLGDLLSTTRGITISRNGGPGQTTAVRIRGAEDSQTLVLIDGVRVNDPSSPGGAFDFGNLLTGSIDRVEVLRGPNSVPWGSQALGGVVNIITAPAPAELSARLAAEYGEKNNVELVGQIGDSIGPVAASLGGGYFHDDGISAFKLGTERDGYRQYAANGRVKVTLSSDVNIDLRGYFADSRVAFDGYLPDYSFGDTSNFSKTQQVFGYAGLNAAIFDGALKNRIAFTLSDTRRDTFDGVAPAPTFLAHGRVERFEYQGDAALASWLRGVFGVEHETSRFNDGTTRFSTGVTSGYAQLIVRPLATLTLTGGLRVDDHRTYGTKTTASANAAWHVGAGTVIRASYGEGFKAPTLNQLYSDAGNVSLQPETARSFDFGIEQSLVDQRLRAGVTIFRRDTREQIGFFDCFGVDPADNPLCSNRDTSFGYYYNVDRTRAEGLEAFVEMRPSSALNFRADYTLVDAKDRATGDVLLRRPRHSIAASIDWTPQKLFAIGASLQSVSDSRDYDYRSFAITRLYGHTLATLRASIPLGRLELYGRIENLFDTRYETVSGYGNYDRNAHVGVRVKL